MLSIVTEVSFMELTRKVAHKHNVWSKTAKLVCFKGKNYISEEIFIEIYNHETL